MSFHCPWLALGALLDRVVPGAPIALEAMGMKHRWKEHSRRSDGQCDLHVIVAGTIHHRNVLGQSSREKFLQEVLTASGPGLKL